FWPQTAIIAGGLFFGFDVKENFIDPQIFQQFQTTQPGHACSGLACSVLLLPGARHIIALLYHC
ncbi:MAG: hypothetical protein LBT62_07005, partial [Deltaproteobacteria bacterium]|nr:hypothetical protein [Deltaproteobacteria bacterium]